MKKLIKFTQKYWLPLLPAIFLLFGISIYFKNSFFIKKIIQLFKTYGLIILFLLVIVWIIFLIVKQNKGAAKAQAIKQAQQRPLSLEDQFILKSFKLLCDLTIDSWQIQLKKREFPGDDIVLEGIVEGIPIKVLAYTEYSTEHKHQVKTIVTIPCEHAILLDLKISTKGFLDQKKWGQYSDITIDDTDFDSKFTIQSSKEHYPSVLLDQVQKEQLLNRKGFLGSLLNIKKNTFYYAEYNSYRYWTENYLKEIISTAIAYTKHLKNFKNPEQQHLSYFVFPIKQT